MTTDDVRRDLARLRVVLKYRLRELVLRRGRSGEDEADLLVLDAPKRGVRLGDQMVLRAVARAAETNIRLLVDAVHDPEDQAIAAGQPELADEAWLNDLSVEQLIHLVAAFEP